MALLDNHGLDGPLRQGDILRDLTLYISNPDGEPAPCESTMGIVVSRHCNAIRAETVLIAAILPYHVENLSKIDEGKPSLDEIRRRFEAIRNGDGKPDRFYLGTLPEHRTTRFAARLDLIHTIEIPKRDPERSDWIADRRFARLSDEHRRHLHARIFTAIASEGFDDFQWWPDDDLKMVLLAGKRQIRAVETKQDEIAGQLTMLGSERLDQKSLDRKRDSLEKQMRNADKELQAHREALRPYQEEWDRRRPTAESDEDSAS